jgi:hypothetical protein
VRLPILVLKSPHITVLNWGCNLSSVADIYSAAVISRMLRFFSDATGGRYIFAMFSLSLFGKRTFANRLYSFPATCSIYN